MELHLSGDIPQRGKQRMSVTDKIENIPNCLIDLVNVCLITQCVASVILPFRGLVRYWIQSNFFLIIEAKILRNQY